MNGRTARIAVTTGMLLLLCCALAIPAQAEKRGTASFVVGLGVTGSILQFSESHLFWHGRLKGAGHNLNGDFLKDNSWDCYGTNVIKDGMADAGGHCIITDTDGDQIFVRYSGKYKITDPFAGKGIFFDGTGKYKGINGVNSFTCITVAGDASCTCMLEYTLP